MELSDNAIIAKRLNYPSLITERLNTLCFYTAAQARAYMQMHNLAQNNKTGKSN